MRRLIASLVSLFLLAGISVPLALALSADPPHACCIRKKPHCHTMEGSDASEHALYAPSCANHSCCRALSASHWAHPQAPTNSAVVRERKVTLHEANSIVHVSDLKSAHAVRGPPKFS